MRPGGHLPSDEGEAPERQLDLLGRVNAKVAKEVARVCLPSVPRELKTPRPNSVVFVQLSP